MAPKNHKKGKKPGDDKNIEDNKDMEMELVKSSKDQVPDQPEEIEAASAPQATVNTTESQRKKSGGPRGVCAMYKVLSRKSRGKKLKITYNERGVPNGMNRAKLQSYIGMLARNMVPIDLPSWPKVDSELKDKIWNDVQVVYKFLNCI